MIAIIVVLVELASIAWIRWRYMNTRVFPAAFQIMAGGARVSQPGY